MKSHSYKSKDGAELQYLFFDGSPGDSGEPVPLIIFMHGIFQSRRTFAPLAKRLARQAGCRCVAAELRGHGRSDHPGGAFTSKGCAEDVEALIDHLEQSGIDTRHLILTGFSLGAYMVVNYIRYFGERRIAGAVLLDWSPKLLSDDDWALGIMGGSYRESEFRRDLELIEHDYRRFLAHLVWHCVKPPSPSTSKNTSPPLWAWALTPFVSANKSENRKTVHRLWSLIEEGDFREIIKDFKLPVLLVCAVPGSLFLPEAAGWMQNQIGENARLLKIGGHGLFRVSHQTLPLCIGSLNSAIKSFAENYVSKQ